MLARRVAAKLVISSGFKADGEDGPIGPRTLSHPSRAGGRSMKQLVTKFVPAEVHVSSWPCQGRQGKAHVLTRLQVPMDRTC